MEKKRGYFKTRPDFEHAKVRAIEKVHLGKSLSKAEGVAINDQWYFTIVLPVDTIIEIVNASADSGVDPSFLASAWIMKGMNKNG